MTKSRSSRRVTFPRMMSSITTGSVLTFSTSALWYSSLSLKLEEGGAVSLIGSPGVLELLEVVLVDLAALALEIGTAVPAGFWAFVPIQPEPAQARKEFFEGGLGIAFPIGIFDSQDERSASLAGVEPVEERGTGGADVGRAGGARRESDADLFHKRVNVR